MESGDGMGMAGMLPSSVTLCFYHLSLDRVSYHGILFVFKVINCLIPYN